MHACCPKFHATSHATCTHQPSSIPGGGVTFFFLSSPSSIDWIHAPLRRYTHASRKQVEHVHGQNLMSAMKSTLTRGDSPP